MKILLKINPFVNSNPMTWKDAAGVSMILALASFFTVFLIPYDYESIITVQFIFEAVRFFGGVFFTNFVALAGLAKYFTKEKSEEPEKD